MANTVKSSRTNRRRRKLSDEDEKEVFRRFTKGEYRDELAESYGVHINTIQNILNRVRAGKKKK